MVGVNVYIMAAAGDNMLGLRETVGKLEQEQKKAVSTNSAFRMFQQMDSRAQQTNAGAELDTVHQNTIT